MTDRPDFKNCDACEMPRSCQGVRHCAKHHRPRDPGSIMCRVEAMVERHGPATVDDIAPHLPDLSRDQIKAALCNLRTYGRLVITDAQRDFGRGLGSTPAQYDVPRDAPQASARAVIASVFDLGWAA